MADTIRLLQLILTWLLIVAVTLPFVRNSYWIFRILEYPRFQVWVLCCITLSSWIFTISTADTTGILSAIGLGLSIIYLTYKIWPYTSVSSKQMKTIAAVDVNNQVKLFTANVYQFNTRFDQVLQQIEDTEADLVFLVETDKQWETKADKLIKKYPYCLKQPQDNTYGLLFYSKMPIEDGKVTFLVEKDIPSVEATIRLPSGQPVKIWGLHPKPPVPGEDDDSAAKDKEIMKVALKVEKTELPCIVMGDFNDVAWSKVTELFQKTSRLLDPRRGRGFYSTFSANSALVRFPLDYVFCSKHFGLINMKRLPKNGSDHFAILSHFELQHELTAAQSAPQPDLAEKKEAIKTASKQVN